MNTIELKTSDKDILELIKNGNHNFLKELYQKHRKEFGTWAIKHYKIDDETAGEIYQQAFIALYYNIKDGKLTKMNSSVKTYLFAIGKNFLRGHFKMSRKFVDPMEVNIGPGEVDNSIMEKYEHEDLKDIINQLLTKIGEPCKTVLELYYFHHYSMDSIATELNYKTEQIAAKRKFICLKQLRNMIDEAGDQYHL